VLTATAPDLGATTWLSIRLVGRMRTSADLMLALLIRGSGHVVLKVGRELPS
jgi:hypothetical protein